MLLLRKLEQRQLSEKVSKSCEGLVRVDEVVAAIRQSANGKAGGPDGLPMELYKLFESVLAPKICDVLNEAFTEGALPDTMRAGEIILLYKKKDPRDLRNYRPITLLNTDYKLLGKVLGARMKNAVDEIISPNQLGFVPKRVITEASHLTKLIQAYLDETDEEGLLIALDMEKAFDRCSWDYLRNAFRSAGFGPGFCNMIDTIYNDGAPPMRTVRTNGVRSDPFPIYSGVPQGDTFAPLAFLMVAESLTRLILDDTSLKGIVINNHEFKISQFADDTLMFLRGWAQLRRMWQLLEIWELGTAMRANKDKTEGLRGGALRRRPPPLIDELRTASIKFPQEGEWVRLLGIPFWEQQGHAHKFWDQLYLKTKTLIACWRHHFDLTIFGRNMLANAMIWSRPRYWTQCMVMPRYIYDAFQSDVQALIWSKEPEFDAETYGTSMKGKRFMKSENQYQPKRALGVGVLHWQSHEKSLRVKWLLKYIDSTTGEWKKVLDVWLHAFLRVVGRRSPTIRLMSSSDRSEWAARASSRHFGNGL